MGVTVVRYRTKADRADENQALIEKVFGELDDRGTQGLRYASFRLADGVSFVHVASVDTDDGTNPLTRDARRSASSSATSPTAARRARSASDATLVGSYGFGFDGAEAGRT